MKPKTRQNPKMLRRRVKHHARMAVVPHERNMYRPHAIRKQGLAIVFVFILCLQLAYNSWHTGSVLGTTADITRQNLLDLTNEVRQQNGSSPPSDQRPAD